MVFVLNKIPFNTCDIQVAKFTYHEVDIEKVTNGSLAESCKKKVQKKNVLKIFSKGPRLLKI